MIIAADLSAIIRAINDAQIVASDLFNLTIRLLDSDLLALLEEPLSPSQSSFLSGLLNTRKLASLSDIAIENDFSVDGLATVDSRIPKLALCCGRKFVYGSFYDHADIFYLRESGVDALYIDNCDPRSLHLQNPFVGNVFRTLDLHDGGADRPSTLLLDCFRYARSVTIYDRFFKSAAASALEDILAAIAAPPLPFKLQLLIGQGHPNWRPTDVEAKFQHFFSHGDLSVACTSRPPGHIHHVHDRYIQIDQRITIELSAGLSAFFDEAGANIHNRSATIIFRNLAIGRSPISLLLTQTGNTIDIYK